MRILHGDGFRLREREEAKETVISNLVMTMFTVMMKAMITMMFRSSVFTSSSVRWSWTNTAVIQTAPGQSSNCPDLMYIPHVDLMLSAGCGILAPVSTPC